MPSFSDAIQAYDESHRGLEHLPRSLVPVHGEYKENVRLLSARRRPLEEYYRWQFIYGLINAGLCPRDHLGAEVHFPKGNANAAALQIDAAIFDDPSWIDRYRAFWQNRRNEDLQWLNDHLLAVIEFKRGEKRIADAFQRQVKPAMREKDPSDAYVVGIYYDEGRLYLFDRRNGRYLRLDDSKNQKGEQSAAGDLSLHLPDPYLHLPSLDDLRNRVNRPSLVDRATRSITDLDVITSIDTMQVRDALSAVLRTMDRVGLVNQRGYEILVQTFALKISDEKRNQGRPQEPLRFFITDEEANFSTLRERGIQSFIGRMQQIRDQALAEYPRILETLVIDWKESDHVRVLASACERFQDFSFIRSSKSDLYQLVFYNFASRFQLQEQAQFLTPIAVIDFLVRIVNPRGDEKVIDPCCGIADFLSLSYVHAQEKPPAWQLDDANIVGLDVSRDMITLASLNMLLNGDGNARLFRVPDKGSILHKVKAGSPPETVALDLGRHTGGNWDDWPDHTRLLKFDVVLTNPPFGEDRAYRPESDFDQQVIELYETWGLVGGDSIDLGVVFLENAVRMLADEGRLGIVLSNSIASTDRWASVREWLLSKVRLTAVFDLPANVFAETGVNTTLLVAYKPKPADLSRLRRDGYAVFARDIKNVGYMRRTSKRNIFFQPRYVLDPRTFDVALDAEGALILDEEFTETVDDFRTWTRSQEGALARIFVEEP
ncbi:MAG: N-6 DNA methylase [Actinobacteria bacterium]|nr:N-6 DNA methylase [Actinomycetota bacterium]